MWRRSLVVVAVIASACGRRSEPVPVPVARDASADAAVQPAIITPIAAPHSGEIKLVAITDRGDAALSVDEHADLRFWPTLDGAREPVVIRGPSPSALALAREHDGFVAALLDAAGGIELVRIAEDGAVRGRQVVPAEPSFVELAASDRAVLARRRDDAIVRLDAEAQGARVLVPQPGEQVLGIAVRGDHAFAAIADRKRPGEIRSVREIQMSGLAWGASYALPQPLASPIAVSPSGRRAGGRDARTGRVLAIELGPQPHVIGASNEGRGGVGGAADEVLGFVDEDHLVHDGGVVLELARATTPADRRDTMRPSLRRRVGLGAVVADGVVVGGHGTHLLIDRGGRAEFLGYRDVGLGTLLATGSQITLQWSHRVLWLGDDLAVHHAVDLRNDALGAFAVDERRGLMTKWTPHPRVGGWLDVVLFESGAREVSLGSFRHGQQLTYDPESSVFAVSGYRMKQFARRHLDATTGKVTPLRPLVDSRDGSATVHLLDPARASGALAVVYWRGSDGLHVQTFLDDGQETTRPLAASSSRTIPDAFGVIGIDQTGTVYALGSDVVYAYKAGAPMKRIGVDADLNSGNVDREGKLLAESSYSHVVLYDLETGRERWRVPVWAANRAAFSYDGATLFVNTQGGLMAFDTQTGARRAAVCGWNFGLATDEPPIATFPIRNVCGDP